MIRFEEFLLEIISKGASDIHVKVGQPYIYRQGGVLHKYNNSPLDLENIENICNAILPSRLQNQYDKRTLDFAWTHESTGRYRVNLFLSNGQPTLALRHVADKIPSIEKLNLPLILKNIALVRSGIIMIVGSTGSGKSTTLASLLEHINQQEFRRIITIEDPIEFLFRDKESVISQKEIGLDIEDFTTGLKYVLRQDPDVIMLGEMRDKDSFSSALKAAETGHLIFTTLHADNAPQAINRILDFYVTQEKEPIQRQLVENLNAIIGQRLVPDVYGGIRPAVEIMISTPTIRKLISENQFDRLAVAISKGREDGMQNFDQALLDLLRKKEITEKTALRYASNPDSLKMNLKGIFLDKGGGIIA